MLLGLVGFVVLTGSAVLGVLMIFATANLSASRKWRKQGLIGLCAGLLRAALATAGWATLLWLMKAHAAAGTWLLFASAGFGWLAFSTLGAYVLLVLLKQPNRWVDRKRPNV